MTVIDITEGADSARTTTVDLGAQAIQLALSRDGSLLAVGTRAPGTVIVIPTTTLEDPTTFTTWDMPSADGDAADEVSAVSWHPTGQHLAVGIDRRDLLFHQVDHSADSLPALQPSGPRLTLGNHTTYGQFTADGQFFLTADLNWDAYPGPLRQVINPPSEMISVRFDRSEAAAHREVSRVRVGQGPEGLAVSAQEDLIATVNMNRTYLPDILTWVPGATINSLSLIDFDNQTGELRTVGEPYGFEGVLPEDAMFDTDGSSLGVVVYNERENPMNPGYVEFWNVTRDGEDPRLERTSVRIPVVRGPHAMNLVP